MTNAFTRAERAIHADRNLSEAADYRSQGRGPAVPLRIIVEIPSGERDVFGLAVRIVNVMTISVPAADATPLKNDTFTRADGTVLTALDAKLIGEGTSWMVTVR